MSAAREPKTAAPTRSAPAYVEPRDCGSESPRANCNCHRCDPDAALDAWNDRREPMIWND